MTITAAADGSSLGNPGPTGWAWYISDEQWAAGGFPHGTNNIGELTAVAELLDATAHVADEPLHILCDSKYVIDSCTKWMRGWKYNGWKKKDGKPVLNVELMQRIDAALQGRKVTFQWVKGHAGHPENEAADERARDAATAFAHRREPIAGPGFGGQDARGRERARGRASGGGADADGGRAEAIAEADAEAALLDVRGDGTVPLWDDEPAGETDAAVVASLERDRIEAAARGNVARLDELLHDDVEIIDSAGRRLARAELLSGLEASADVVGGVGSMNVRDLSSQSVAARVRLVRFDTERDGAVTRCSSTWIFEPAGRGEGRWRLRFHQATPVR